ncbi:class I SAM-dependent methyltransferase [Legionella pneumophila serogroup 1]|uniref:Bifunctional 3-demethylubiquinone-9 3-methyltransferase/ 2-octaprenyl-6-hydroxy phenol methylase n=1 Tax=Fluoribacter dumoffii TaxID=463 RepID=A0A377GBD6_9GAMM|nr:MULTISPECIES: class I SAM-dependent methyltransferase [Legionellaceae]KTC92763.1 bifunctional 3-demethylubiquinone-9 3-methyltransferase/ 2-octaprenyl-6-hydroxy phenol methylase [Fluoribacter dumoffii NY 23]MDW8866346.1 class I SAM-dependent methyltransferase [Legionella pneumophila]MDW9173165.1 class I SAM-dependent methyltransferase [Legionella pneumophila]SNV18262.1 bifunctional 3-demethylubiquinone-9 3-methyltransferase/ 2-octaprenyl-6-hydroxy phenol methylase [Legionella pneumophila]ST
MNKENTKIHWESIYTEKLPQNVSWYQQEPTISLKIIRCFSDKNARIIDVGGGASILVDHLLKSGYSNLAVLDISGQAIEHVKNRLSDQATTIEWFEKDITAFIPPHTYDIWHDRAVFHFLTDIKSRQLYVNVLKNTVKSGSHIIIATFAKDGPQKCSGLDIVQYDNPSIQHELGNEFILLDSQFEMHITPAGKEQRFIYFVFQRK